MISRDIFETLIWGEFSELAATNNPEIGSDFISVR